jgi:hypothetical protein
MTNDRTISTQESEPVTLADDLLRGADAIAEFVFGNAKCRRKIYYLAGAAKTNFPVFRLGSVLCARKSTLLRWIEDWERAR